MSETVAYRVERKCFCDGQPRLLKLPCDFLASRLFEECGDLLCDHDAGERAFNVGMIGSNCLSIFEGLFGRRNIMNFKGQIAFDEGLRRHILSGGFQCAQSLQGFVVLCSGFGLLVLPETPLGGLAFLESACQDWSAPFRCAAFFQGSQSCVELGASLQGIPVSSRILGGSCDLRRNSLYREARCSG